MNYELPEEIVVTGSPDNDSAIYVSKEDLIRRLYLGWTLKDIIEFAIEGESV